jgi:hypothetical protein
VTEFLETSGDGALGVVDLAPTQSSHLIYPEGLVLSDYGLIAHRQYYPKDGLVKPQRATMLRIRPANQKER